jgi:hypothetical protein
LKHAGIETVKAKDISAVLFRGQVATLIDVVNNTRRENEYKRIAENLQGVLDSRSARHLAQDFWRSKGGFRDTAGQDGRTGSIDERIPPDPGIESSGRNDAIQLQNPDGSKLKE